MKKTLLFCFLLLNLTLLIGQNQRYLDQIYSEVKVDSNVVYGVNATILTVADPRFKQAMPQALVMDIYSPVGDNLAARPLILYYHTGNFLPYPQNGSVSGTRRD